MRVVLGVILAGLTVFGLSQAASSTAPDRPPGIAADRWAPVSNTLGFVLVPDSEMAQDPARPPAVSGAGGPTVPGSPIDMTALYAEPTAAVKKIIEEGRPVRGYIMVKRGNVWRPLAVVAPTVEN
jgi:hypothetical protein